MNPPPSSPDPAARSAPLCESQHSAIFWLVAVVAVLLGLFQAWSIMWIHDDIFVTLRYVDNWSRGLGLVFNEGERVEGFTHPLWLALLMAAKALGADPVSASMWLGLVSYAGVLALVVWISWKMQPRGFFFIPMTALALVLNFEFRVWATSGLETMFFTFLLLSAFVAAYFTSWPTRVKLLLSGALLTAALATRPDAAILWAMGNLIVLFTRPHSSSKSWITILQRVLLFNAAFILLFIPWLIWKTGYYGELLPNTYYAKSASSWKLAQGFWYIWTFLRAYPSTSLSILAIPILALMLIRQLRSSPQPVNPNQLPATADKAISTAIASMILYLGLFVIRVGGDYMFARMIIPALPFAWITIEWLLIRTFFRRPAILAIASLALPLVVMAEIHLRNHFILPHAPTSGAFTEIMARNRGISDEYWYYTTPFFDDSPLNMVQRQKQIGETLRPFFDGEDVTVLFVAENIMAYYSRVKTAIEYNGLTDKTIARGKSYFTRPGHEKRPTDQYLYERGVDFYFMELSHLKFEPYQLVQFHGPNNSAPIYAALFTFDPALLQRIAAKSDGRFVYTAFGEWLDYYIHSTLPSLSKDKAHRDMAKFQNYYFRWTDDLIREQELNEKILNLD